MTDGTTHKNKIYTHYAHATVHTGPLTTLLHWSEGRAHRMHAARGTHARRRLLRQVRTRSIDHEAYAFTATPSRLRLHGMHSSEKPRVYPETSLSPPRFTLERRPAATLMPIR